MKSASLMLLAFVVVATTACGSARIATDPLLATPTPVIAAHPSFDIPPTEIAMTAIFDITTSADRFGPEAKTLLANSLALWTKPGRGGVDLTVNVLSSRSWDEASQLLAVHLDGMPESPTRRATISRPAAPLLEACAVNTFDRSNCTSKATAAYNDALAVALADEVRADSELRTALADFATLEKLRKSQSAALAERVTNLDLGHESRGSDVAGALLRGAETLHHATAPKRLLLIQSDLVPYGPQQPGALDLRGIDVVVFFFDCPQGLDCRAFRQANEQAFLAAGATSVTWLDAGASRLSSNIFEEVR